MLINDIRVDMVVHCFENGFNPKNIYRVLSINKMTKDTQVLRINKKNINSV